MSSAPVAADIEQNYSPRSLNATHGHPSFGTPQLPQAALCNLASASKRFRSVSDWNLNLAELPASVRAKLADFDSDGASACGAPSPRSLSHPRTGDGMVSLEEIMMRGAELEHARMRVRLRALPHLCLAFLMRASLQNTRLMWIVFALFALLFIQTAATFGVVFGAVNYSRQSDVSGNVLVAKGTETPLQISSADFYVDSTGTMRVRAPLSNATSRRRRNLLQLSTEATDGAMSILAAAPPKCYLGSADFNEGTGACATADALSTTGQNVITVPLVHPYDSKDQNEYTRPFLYTSVAYFSNVTYSSSPCRSGQLYLYTLAAGYGQIGVCVFGVVAAGEAPDYGTTAFIDYSAFTPPAGFMSPCTAIVSPATVTTSDGYLLPSPFCLYPSLYTNLTVALSAPNTYTYTYANAIAHSVRRKLLSSGTERKLLANCQNPSFDYCQSNAGANCKCCTSACNCAGVCYV
jgi:hypothetical protein